jgi:hypothetical protein
MLPRPAGVTASTILLHVLNLLTLIFIRWGEADSLFFALLFALYVLFTALVIHAYFKGQTWARWLILIRSILMLATIKMLLLEGGLHLIQGVVERILAPVLLVYLNLPSVRAWYAAKPAR